MCKPTRFADRQLVWLNLLLHEAGDVGFQLGSVEGAMLSTRTQLDETNRSPLQMDIERFLGVLNGLWR